MLLLTFIWTLKLKEALKCHNSITFRNILLPKTSNFRYMLLIWNEVWKKILLDIFQARSPLNCNTKKHRDIQQGKIVCLRWTYVLENIFIHLRKRQASKIQSYHYKVEHSDILNVVFFFLWKKSVVFFLMKKISTYRGGNATNSEENSSSVPGKYKVIQGMGFLSFNTVN